MSLTIYHNPRCSKSREALQLLREHTDDLQIVEYLKTPPDHATLKRLLKMLGLEPRELMRRKEPDYRALNLDDPNLTRDQLVQAMVDHPKLIERPVVTDGKHAALGRPPKNVLDLL